MFLNRDLLKKDVIQMFCFSLCIISVSRKTEQISCLTLGKKAVSPKTCPYIYVG